MSKKLMKINPEKEERLEGRRHAQRKENNDDTLNYMETKKETRARTNGIKEMFTIRKLCVDMAF